MGVGEQEKEQASEIESGRELERELERVRESERERARDLEIETERERGTLWRKRALTALDVFDPALLRLRKGGVAV